MVSDPYFFTKLIHRVNSFAYCNPSLVKANLVHRLIKVKNRRSSNNKIFGRRWDRIENCELRPMWLPSESVDAGTYFSTD